MLCWEGDWLQPSIPSGLWPTPPILVPDCLSFWQEAVVIRTKTSRHMNGFFPSAVGIFNKSQEPNPHPHRHWLFHSGTQTHHCPWIFASQKMFIKYYSHCLFTLFNVCTLLIINLLNLFLILILMILTISLCGLCETNSTGVDVVHVMDWGAVWLLCNRFFVLQDLRDGLHRSWVSWFNLPAFRLDGNRTQILSHH